MSRWAVLRALRAKRGHANVDVWASDAADMLVAENFGRRGFAPDTGSRRHGRAAMRYRIVSRSTS